MRRFKLILFLIALSAMAGCLRRPFGEDRTAIKIVLNVKTDIKHEVNKVPKPELMRVILCDQKSGEVKYDDYISADGGYIYPHPGTYDILIYNISTVSTTTIVRYGNNYYTAEATTDKIPDFVKAQLRPLLAARKKAIEKALAETLSKGESPPDVKDDTKAEEDRIMNEPDHLFVGRKNDVKIPELEVGESKDIVISMEAQTIVEKWDVILNNVKGLEYIQSAKALMSGLVESTVLYNEKDSEDPILIFFEMHVDRDKNALVGTFRTFGKDPAAKNELHIDLGITDVGGNEHFEEFDVTDQFDDNENHIIIVDKPIVIDKPVINGGFAPEVGNWDDVHIDMEI